MRQEEKNNKLQESGKTWIVKERQNKEPKLLSKNNKERTKTLFTVFMCVEASKVIIWSIITGKIFTTSRIYMCDLVRIEVKYFMTKKKKSSICMCESFMIVVISYIKKG